MTTPNTDTLKDTLDQIETPDLVSALVRRCDQTIIITTHQPHLSIPKHLFSIYYGDSNQDTILQLLSRAFTLVLDPNFITDSEPDPRSDPEPGDTIE